VALMFVPSENRVYEFLLRWTPRHGRSNEYCRSRSILFRFAQTTLHANLRVIAMGLRGLQIEENARTAPRNLNGLRQANATTTSPNILKNRHPPEERPAES